MKHTKVTSLIAGSLFLGLGAPGSYAEECNYTWMLFNEDGSKPSKAQYVEKERKETECKKRVADQKKQAANARKRLKSEFKIDSSGMPDGEAVARLQEEVDNRRRANEDEQQRREEAAQARRMTQIEQAMEKQNQMLKGLGVNLGNLGAGGDSDIDPAELQMYQQMVNNGVAPHCKGKKGEALIECVDAAVDGK